MSKLPINGDVLEKLVTLDMEGRRFNRLMIAQWLINIILFVSVGIAFYLGNVIVIRAVGIAAIVLLTVEYFWWRKETDAHYSRCNKIVGIDRDHEP